MDDQPQPDAASGDSPYDVSTAPASEHMPVLTATQQPPVSASPIASAEGTMMGSTPSPAPEQPYPHAAPYPQAPAQFPYAGAPSAPLAPAYPEYPGYPGYAPYPPYPGDPSMPLSTTPGTPTYPSAPYPYPGYPGYPTYPGYTATPSVPLHTQVPNPYATIPLSPRRTPLAILPRILTFLRQPFSRLVSASIIGGALFIVALGFLVNANLARADWSDSAVPAAIVAFVLAGLTIIATSLRVAVGRRVRSMLLLALAMVVGLSALGGVSLTVSAPLHSLQAHVFEFGSDWEAAIHEYTLAGEAAPNAPDIARVHDEWGEQLLKRQSYQQATDHFSTVINTYTNSDAPLDRAYKDQFNTYRAWLQDNTPDTPYFDILGYFDQYRASTHCNAACSATIEAIRPQTLYQYGMQLMGQRSYSLAALQFEELQKKYPATTYAPKAHTAAAQAYYQYGQQQRTASCELAVGAYQTLAKDYADTPEGQKAKTELTAPQNVTGYLTGFPAGVEPIMYLSRHADPKTGDFSGEYRAFPGSDGHFTFLGVAQGNYDIAAIWDINGSTYWDWYYNIDTGSPYTVHVGPLCTVDYGPFRYVSA